MSTSLPYITVIVPVYNGRDFLTKCLDALFSSTYRSFEVLVVNDCSSDDSGEIAAAKGVQVISTPKRSGPGAARNLAAEAASGEILLFVDADVVVKPETLERIAKRFRENPELSALFGSYDDEPAEKNFLSQYKNLQHHFVHQQSNPEASTFWSGLGAMRRKVFLEHEGFDNKKFSEPSIEDIDLGYRLRRSGHKIVLDKDIQAKHLKKWSISSHLRTEIFSRAMPWSRLIHENDKMINDMNLKTSDRASAVIVALSLVVLPLAFFEPLLVIFLAVFLLVIALLNHKILRFFAVKRGIGFAIMAFPWQILYFFYSGCAFVATWLIIGLPRLLGRKGSNHISEATE